MKKTLAILLALTICLALFAGCQTKAPITNEDTGEKGISALPNTPAKNEDIGGKVISALPKTLDINNLDNCTVAISLDKGDAKVTDSGKMVMDVTVYSYELYDMVDIAELAAGDVLMRQGEEVKVSSVERLDSGLVRINGGEEQGGFDLTSGDSTVYYEVGMDDAKAYYALGKVTLPVSDEFVYHDASNPDGEAIEYYPGDFLTEDAGIVYNFTPNNTSIVIENGEIIHMNTIYMP